MVDEQILLGSRYYYLTSLKKAVDIVKSLDNRTDLATEHKYPELHVLYIYNQIRQNRWIKSNFTHMAFTWHQTQEYDTFWHNTINLQDYTRINNLPFLYNYIKDLLSKVKLDTYEVW